MYVLLSFILACLLGWLLWRKLCGTSIPTLLRAIIPSLCIVIIFVILFWIGAYFSFFEL